MMLSHNMIQAFLWASMGFILTWMLFHSWLQVKVLPEFHRRGYKGKAANALFATSVVWTGFWLIATLYNVLQFVGAINE